MTKKRFWLGILIIVLVFGMVVLGCEDEEEKTTPATPTGLARGTVTSNSVALTWNAVSGATEYWIEYVETSKGFPFRDGHFENITGTSYTVTGLKGATEYSFRVAAHNGYTSEWSTPITVKTLNHETASVSVSMYTSISTLSYSITISLKLADNAYWDIQDGVNIYDTAKSWITLSGTPALATLEGGMKSATKHALDPSILDISYMVTGTSSTPNLTVTLDQTKLSEMRTYTNVTTSLTAGTPISVTKTAWDQDFRP